MTGPAGPSRSGGPPVARARLLGAFSLTDPSGADLSGAGRKARAIVSRLVLANGRPIPRREIMAFAWSGRAADQARASLRQALHEARRLLRTEPPLLIADRDTVRIDISRLDTDLGDILAHARAGRIAELAAALASPAPLLADLDGVDATIDLWLADERRRWQATLQAELDACAERARASGRSEDARRLAALRTIPGRPEVAPPPAARAPPRRRRWPRLAAAAAMVALVALAAGYALQPRQGDDILVVEPLQASPADQAAQAVRAGLSGDLARVMVGRPAGLAVAQADDPRSSPRPAQLALEGAAATRGGVLRVHLQLTDRRSGAILWSRNFAGPPVEAEALREQAATKLGSVLNCALGARHRGADPVGERPTILYLRACDLIGDDDLDAALDLLRQVTVQAPGFARAWADLAVTRALTADDGPAPERAAADDEADRAARRALRLDPRTGLAYYALAATRRGIANWPRRVAILEQGLRVEPDGPELDDALGEELLRVGRSREGVDYLKRSVRFDPLNPVKTAALIPMLAFHGDLDDARTLATKARALWPRDPAIWGAVFAMEARRGDPRKALAMARDPDRLGVTAPEAAARWAATLRARLDPSPAATAAAVAAWTAFADQRTREDPLPIALTVSALGRTNLAYRMLARDAPVDDDMDERMFRDDAAAFRADRRFMALAARRGLVAVWRATDRWPDVCAAGPEPRDCRAGAAAASAARTR